MANRLQIKGKTIQANQFYKATLIKEGKYFVYIKSNDSYYYCTDYKIVGAGLLVELENGDRLYVNYEKMQEVGQGRVSAAILEIDAWKEVRINKNIVTALQYFDEKGLRFIRCLDENGNFYKPSMKINFEEEKELNI